MATSNSSLESIADSTAVKTLDLMTQPRFLLPTVFPFIVALGWYGDTTGSLSSHLFAAVLISLGGWLAAMIVEYQPVVPLADGTINEIQGVLLFVVAAAIYVVWNQNGWPLLVQGFGMVSATAVALWLPARQVLNLSGGVIFPTALFVYLTLSHFWLAPLLLVLVIRIPVALTIEDLTPLETVVGVSLGCLSVLLVVLLTPVG